MLPQYTILSGIKPENLSKTLKPCGLSVNPRLFLQC